MARRKRSRGKRISRQGEFRLRFNPLSLAVATAMGTAGGMLVGPAWAQQADDADAAEEESTVIEEIVVTGFRQSLQNAMALKRDSDLIVEAISAEDIGKLPDNSIAEALTRLTGLAGQRLNGRQQVISIRGLAPDFSTALLNGRQQVSAGDNRGVEFDQYPSELLSGVVVYKTPAASLTGQGLAGTVDMRTINPLEYGERTIAANVRNEWSSVDSLNPEIDESGLRYSLSYIDQFAEGTLGVALGFSHIDSPSQREVIDIWGYENSYGPTGGARVLSGGNVKAQSGGLQRDGIMAVIEYQPNDRVSSTVDIYRSSFEETTLSRQYSMPLFPPWNGNQPTLTNIQTDDGLVTSGTYGNIKAVLGNNLETRDSELWAAGWNLDVDVNEAWTATFDISHSAIEREDVVLALNSGTGPNRQGALDTIDFSVGARKPNFSGALNYTEPGATSLTSPKGWGGWGSRIPGGQVGYENRPSIDDELTQVRLSAERYLDGPISSVAFGVQFDSRTKSRNNSNQGFLGLLPRGTLSLPFTSTGVVRMPFGLPPIAAFDTMRTFNSGIYYRVDHLGGGVHANTWSVDEDVNIAYLQFGVDTTVGDTPLTGNFGVQAVRTDQSSTGVSGAAGRPAASRDQAILLPISGGASYTDYLPSVNLNFLIAEGQFIRLGAARTLARARMDEMRAGRDVNFNASLAASTNIASSPWSGRGGNPELKPWVADSIDLSYERYFRDGLGYFALAAFYKDLRTYIYELPLLVDFSDYPTGGVTPALTAGIVNRPSNGEGGTLSGYELSLQLSGEMLTPSLAGFGAVLNGSFTDSEIERGTGDPSTPLPGLSDTVVNLTLYYEQGGLSVRVSGNRRSDFLGEVQGFGASRNLRSITEENLVDAQVSYAFEGGRLDGLTLYLQGTNLTDEPFTGFLNNDHRQIKDWQAYGSTYFFGGSYRY